MTASKELIYFLVWPLPEIATGILCNCLVGALPWTGIQYVIPSFPLRGVMVLHSARKDLTRPPAMVTAETKRKKKKEGGGRAIYFPIGYYVEEQSISHPVTQDPSVTKKKKNCASDQPVSHPIPSHQSLGRPDTLQIS